MTTMKMPYTCYLSLGANLGDRVATLQQGISLLRDSAKIQLLSVSSMYETPPWGKLDQPAFINCAAAVETVLEPLQLLAVCQQIEQRLGRVRHEHWGARTIDIDLLYIDGVVMDERELQLPHPYMLERSFVLVPLAEIAPDMMIAGEKVTWHRDRLSDRHEIVLQVLREEIK